MEKLSAALCEKEALLQEVMSQRSAGMESSEGRRRIPSEQMNADLEVCPGCHVWPCMQPAQGLRPLTRGCWAARHRWGLCAAVWYLWHDCSRVYMSISSCRWNRSRHGHRRAVLPVSSGLGVQALRRRLAEVYTENEALKSELNAFDPDFWDEIEDLKFERQELGEKVVKYENIIRSMATQLGRIPPV